MASGGDSNMTSYLEMEIKVTLLLKLSKLNYCGTNPKPSQVNLQQAESALNLVVCHYFLSFTLMFGTLNIG